MPGDRCITRSVNRSFTRLMTRSGARSGARSRTRYWARYGYAVNAYREQGNRTVSIRKAVNVQRQLEEQVLDRAWKDVLTKSATNVSAKVWSKVRRAVGAFVWNRVWTHVGSQVRSQVGNVRSAVDQKLDR